MSQTNMNHFEEIIEKRRSRSPITFFVIIILILLVIFIGWRSLGGKSGFLQGGDSTDYQAVFLDNNQVYFGKLIRTRGEYLTLTEIFYLQVDQSLQPSQPNPNITLVKLGNELHGPTDRMEINREHILFIENLRADSQVVKGIEKYFADNKSK